MNKPPAFQFYADDFLGGTVTMNFAQRGLYITLLCIQWSRGFVTQDDIDGLLDGVAIATPLAKRVISKFEVGADGNLRNARMESIRAKRESYIVKCSESGKAGAMKRWGGHSQAIERPMAKNSSPVSSLQSPLAPPTVQERQAVGECREIPDLPKAIGMIAAAGIPEDFATMVYGVWSRRQGRDGAGVLVGWLDYVTGRWVNEQVEWKAGTHRGNRKAEARLGGADKINLGKEYERILAKLKTLSATEDHMERDAKTKEELRKLRARRDELKKILGVTI